MTHPLVQVALALSADVVGQHWGYELSKASGVRSGVLYPILDRMLCEGWLTDGWEDPPPGTQRPRRRYYELTDKGRRQIGAVTHRAALDPRFAALFGVAQ